MSQVSRRDFVIQTCAACAAVGALDAVLSAQSTSPSKSSAAPIDIGTIEDFPKGQISGKFLKSGMIISHLDDRIVAMSSRCTHRNAMLNVNNSAIKCPAHGSTFSEQGTPTGGPARSSLFRYAIKLDDNKRLLVDKSKSFGEKEWDKDDAFVKTT